MIGQLAVLINGSLSPLDFSPPVTYFDIDFAALAYYFPFYLLGTLLYANQHLFQVLESKRLMIVIGLLSIFFFTLFLYLNNLMLVDIFQHAELNQF